MKGNSLSKTTPATPEPEDGTKDRFLTGSIWVGIAKWSDQESHTFLLVITERQGKKFKAINRWDFGIQNKPDDRGFSDVEGEVNKGTISFRRGEELNTGKITGNSLKFTGFPPGKERTIEGVLKLKLP